MDYFHIEMFWALDGNLFKKDGGRTLLVWLSVVRYLLLMEPSWFDRRLLSLFIASRIHISSVEKTGTLLCR